MLNILCALHCEAKPLIQRFGLKQNTTFSLFPIFENEDIRLIVSGTGKIPAASAATFLGTLNKEPSAWLNIGIAGHPSKSLGSYAAAHSILDESSKKKYYPGIAHFSQFSSSAVTTVDQPQCNYPKECLYEMEAAGFFHAAQKFSTVEFIHSFKVVSDNLQSPANRLNKGLVQELIQTAIDPIESFIHQLQSLVPKISGIVDTAPYEKHCKWSQTELYQLIRLLTRWTAS